MNLDIRPHEWQDIILDDALQLLLGPMLGEGIARAVYPLSLNADLVIKLESAKFSFQNAAEWALWEEVKHSERWSKWLAPCIAISPCGRALIQKRTTPLPVGFTTPSIPGFLTDIKPGNFGFFDGRLVAHDYGKNNFASSALTAAHMRKIPREWWLLDPMVKNG